MQFLWSPLKRSFMTSVGVIAILSMTLSACGGGSSSGTATNCTPGSNTQLVKTTSAHKIGWSQNALDGAWRNAEEGSIDQAASAGGYQLVKFNANNSDVQQVQDIKT